MSKLKYMGVAAAFVVAGIAAEPVSRYGFKGISEAINDAILGKPADAPKEGKPPASDKKSGFDFFAPKR